MTLGMILKHHRNIKGFTQKQVACHLGISIFNISDIEQDKKTPVSSKALFKFSLYYKIKLSTLVKIAYKTRFVKKLSKKKLFGKYKHCINDLIELAYEGIIK